MNKKFLNKNKFTIFALAFLTLLFILLIFAKQLFFPNMGSAIYGDRLEGIVEVTKEDKTKVTDKLKENENVIKSNVELNGKIFQIFITLKDEINLNDAKKIGASTLENIKEEVKKDYDIQIFISKDNKELNNFPIIGYKHHSNDELSWNKDREVKKEDKGEK